MSQISPLESAINTVVNQFHSASGNNSGTLNPTEFKSLLTSQLPNLMKGVNLDQGMGEILRKMGVGEGEGISFKHFWSLIQSLAGSQFSGMSGGQRGCTCILL
ncbi:unnamed protein product [Ophioblennius macclurei]